MKKSSLLLLPILSYFFFLPVPNAFADSQTINFESPTYSTGTINGQDGWTKTGSYDAAVVSNTYGYSSFGSQSFRISDAVTSGSFGDQTFAKPLTNAVGEVDSTAGSFSIGTLQRHFEMQFDIASTMSTQQSGMHLSVSPDRGDGSRMSYLLFEDGTSGMNVFFQDVQGTTNPANFVETQIGTGLSRSVPHTIKLTLDALDGPSNDIVKVWIDGSLVHIGTSWENYYRYASEASAEQSPRIIKTVLFREAGTANSADAGNGFLIDNLSLNSSPIPTTFDLNDATINGNNLTNYGVSESTDTPFAVSAKSANFVASENDYLQAADAASLRPTGNFTIETWVKLTAMPGGNNYPKLFQSYSENSGIAGIALYINGDNNKLSFLVGKATGVNPNIDYKILTGNTTLTTGTWYHVAAVYNESTMEIFLNGVSDGSVSWSGDPSYAGTNYVRIGAGNRTGTNEWFLNGKLDEIRLWNVARTQQQLSTNYQNELTGADSGLTAYYPFDSVNPSPFDFREKTSNGNNLTNHYAAEYTTNFPFAASKEAIDINSSDADYVQAADSSSLDLTNAFTIEFWLKPESNPGNEALAYYVSKSDGFDGNGAYRVYTYNNSNNGVYKFGFSVSNDGNGQGGFDDFSINHTPTIGEWHHYAVTWNGSTKTGKIYRDGIQIGGDIVGSHVSSIYNSSLPLRIGARADTAVSAYDGQIDDVRIWNVARTATQINNNKDVELTGSESGLVAYYPFEAL